MAAPKLECPKCGRRIRVKGKVWRWRATRANYNKWGVSKDYYCDECADKREMGMEG